MIMMNSSNKIYRLICILDSTTSNYLHIHILDSSYLENFSKFSATLQDQPKNNFLYQWGNISHLKEQNRSPKVKASEIKKFGHIGIGSAWRGIEKIDGIGGGEGFLFNTKNFRIIKGNEVVAAKAEEEYWNFQIADFNGAQKISELQGKEISGREELTKILKNFSKGQFSTGQIFIASFEAKFIGDFFARSNGIFPEDEVLERSKSLFTSDIKGGHLVGGSRNSGDIKSLKEKFSENEALTIDFTIQITSDILLKSATELVILT